MKEAEVFAKVQGIIESTLEQGQPAPAAWIVHAVLQDYPMVEFEYSDFYTLSAGKYVRDLVQRAANRYKVKPETETDPQLVLPGFKRLQKGYFVERDGEPVLVSITALSPRELAAKADELDQMAAGCIEHADELRRYLKERTAA